MRWVLAVACDAAPASTGSVWLMAADTAGPFRSFSTAMAEAMSPVNPADVPAMAYSASAAPRAERVPVAVTDSA